MNLEQAIKLLKDQKVPEDYYCIKGRCAGEVPSIDFLDGNLIKKTLGKSFYNTKKVLTKALRHTSGYISIR